MNKTYPHFGSTTPGMSSIFWWHNLVKVDVSVCWCFLIINWNSEHLQRCPWSWLWWQEDKLCCLWALQPLSLAQALPHPGGRPRGFRDPQVQGHHCGRHLQLWQQAPWHCPRPGPQQVSPVCCDIRRCKELKTRGTNIRISTEQKWTKESQTEWNPPHRWRKINNMLHYLRSWVILR